MIAFRYGFTPEEWWEWHNQPNQQRYRLRLAALQQTKDWPKNDGLYVRKMLERYVRYTEFLMSKKYGAVAE